MSKIENVIADIGPQIKALGYKKRKNVWYKKKDRLTVFFGIQKSQYSSDVWYYHFGIFLDDIGDEKHISLDKCHINYRMDHIIDKVFVTSDIIINLLSKWEQMYGDIQKLRICAIENKLPLLTTRKAKQYLSSWDISSWV